MTTRQTELVAEEYYMLRILRRHYLMEKKIHIPSIKSVNFDCTLENLMQLIVGLRNKKIVDGWITKSGTFMIKRVLPFRAIDIDFRDTSKGRKAIYKVIYGYSVDPEKLDIYKYIIRCGNYLTHTAYAVKAERLAGVSILHYIMDVGAEVRLVDKIKNRIIIRARFGKEERAIKFKFYKVFDIDGEILLPTEEDMDLIINSFMEVLSRKLREIMNKKRKKVS